MTQPARAFNAGKTWTRGLELELCADFDRGADLKTLCEKFGRTGSAIIAKLQANHRLTNSTFGPFYKIDPDPWVIAAVVRDIDNYMKETPSARAENQG